MILSVLVLILAVLLFGSAAVTSFFGIIGGVIAFCFAWTMFATATATGLDLWPALGVAVAGFVGLFVVVGLPLLMMFDTYERKKYGLPKRKSLW